MKIIHIVMRFADFLIPGISTIEEHQKVLLKHGNVWITKVGKTIAESHIRLIQRQVDAGEKSFLFLVTKKGKKYSWHRGAILKIQKDAPKTKGSAIPLYYSQVNLLRRGAVWFQLSSMQAVSIKVVETLEVASSGKPILVSIQRSMAGVFLASTATKIPAAKETNSGRPKSAIDDLEAWAEENWTDHYAK